MAQASGMSEGLGMIVDQVAQEKGIDRTVLRGRCLPRPLEVDPDDGTVKCVVVEAIRSGGTCDCKKLPGRRPAAPELITRDIAAAGDCFRRVCGVRRLGALPNPISGGNTTAPIPAADPSTAPRSSASPGLGEPTPTSA